MMKNKLAFIPILLLSISPLFASNPYCNIPKECQVFEHTHRHMSIDRKGIKCLLDNDESMLRFNQPVKKDSCELLKKEDKIKELIIRPGSERVSLKLRKGMIDPSDLIEYTNRFPYVDIMLQFFSGFDLNLFNTNNNSSNTIDYDISKFLTCMYCTFDFYLGEKLLKTCQDFTENPKSVFQLFTNVSKFSLSLYLAETNNKICPLAFKYFEVFMLKISGENSFHSQRLLSFSPQKFDDLNTKIEYLIININNVDLDFKFLHPSIFKSLLQIEIISKVDKIDANLFVVLENVTDVHLKLEYMRSLIHTNGIEWIKNMNKDINCDLTNRSQVIEYIVTNRIKFIHHDVDNSAISPPLRQVFPDEDFCLYKDFPINQLVIIFKKVKTMFELKRTGKEFGCTYLWITRHYKDLIKIVHYENDLYLVMKTLLDSDDYKSISRCKFEEKLGLCNKSEFEHRSHITTFFEIGEAMYTIEIVLNILSFILVVFGLVSNSLIIIAISSKKNHTEFKGFKQYNYLRLNSICNCFILLIHMSSWLNQCIYPYQVFCPLIRKAVFMQYMKIIVQDVLMTALRFMNNFTYVGFAFNRISLIGKDHNKLVKFMCKIGIKKYIATSLFISIGLSVIKFFEYDINQGISVLMYPIVYDYLSSSESKRPNVVFFILNFISDILNHFVFLLVNLAIDIGMVIKLRKTLDERLENFKAYSTVTQQEKKKTENEHVLDNAISMVILNTSLNLILKFPISLYSLIYLCYGIYRQYVLYSVWDNRNLERFFKRVCIDANFCDMFLKLSEFLYLLSISLQFFFYKHYDKKLNLAIKKKFGSDKSIQTGLLSMFNLVNVVTSPYIADVKLESKAANQ